MKKTFLIAALLAAALSAHAGPVVVARPVIVARPVVVTARPAPVVAPRVVTKALPTPRAIEPVRPPVVAPIIIPSVTSKCTDEKRAKKECK